LPNLCKWHTALRRSWFRRLTSRRRRTDVIGDPEPNLPPFRIGTNILRGNDAGFSLFCWDSRTVHAGAKSLVDDVVHPTVDIGFLLGQHSPAFLDIKKENRAGRKAFAPGGGNGFESILLSKRGRIAFQFLVKSAVEEHNKSEAGRLQGTSLSEPAI